MQQVFTWSPIGTRIVKLDPDCWILSKHIIDDAKKWRWVMVNDSSCLTAKQVCCQFVKLFRTTLQLDGTVGRSWWLLRGPSNQIVHHMALNQMSRYPHVGFYKFVTATFKVVFPPRNISLWDGWWYRHADTHTCIINGSQQDHELPRQYCAGCFNQDPTMKTMKICSAQSEAKIVMVSL